MKFSTTAAVLAVAIGTSAHPSSHAHRHFHRAAVGPSKFYKSANANEIPVDVKDIKDKVDVAAGLGPEPSYQAHPPPAPEPAPKHEDYAGPKDDQGGKGDGGDNGKGVPLTEFCPNKLNDVAKRATAAQVASMGFTGETFGCGLKPVSAQDAKSVQYTLKLNNIDSAEWECHCFLKAGPNMGLNGSFKNNHIFSVNVAPGKYQYVAIARDSRGACSCSPNGVDYNKVGQAAGVWTEFELANADNSNKDQSGNYVAWSGADASILTAAMAGMPITSGVKVYREDAEVKPSVVCAGGSGDNAYLSASQVAADGIGLNIRSEAKDNVRLAADLGHKC